MNHIQTINSNNAIILTVLIMYINQCSTTNYIVKFLFLRVRSRTIADAKPELLQLTSLLHSTIFKIEPPRELRFKV